MEKESFSSVTCVTEREWKAFNMIIIYFLFSFNF